MQAIKNNCSDLVWHGPGDQASVLSLEVRQAISTLTSIRVQLKCADAELSGTDVLFSEVRVGMYCGQELEQLRYFSGIVTSFGQARTRHGQRAGNGTPFFLYELEIRPKLWLLQQTTRSCIYRSKTARDIVQEILDRYQIQGKWDLNATLPTYDYRVQYAETDYQFISRLLEHEGVCFFFKEDANEVCLADHALGHPSCTPVEEAFYREEHSLHMGFGHQETIDDFVYRETAGAGRFSLHHYNEETPNLNLLTLEQETKKPCAESLEQYRHNQNYPDLDAGTALTQLRLSQQVASLKRGGGTATCRSFAAGHVFKMQGHFRQVFNAKWLLTSVHIQAEPGRYQCHFEALPLSVPFKPPLKTPKPKVTGMQNAMVTGPAGSEVYLDDMGRCKLQFFWDREGQRDDKSSMWVRVAQDYAGKSYGSQWIPRVGHEVLVTFLDGDPDQPVVTGRVYNDFNNPPLGPAEKYQNIIKSIKDNHILFDDTDGKERFDLRAQKDMHTHVLNNQSSVIDADRSINIKGEESQHTVKNRTAKIDQSHTFEVGEDETVTVGGNRQWTLAGDQEASIGGNETFAIDGKKTLTVGEDYTLESTSGKVSVTANAGGIKLQSGSSTISIKPKSINISVGGNTITLNADEIAINGSLIKLN